MSDTAYGTDAAPTPAKTFTPALIRLSAVVILGVMMTILDTTIVNVAIRTLGRDFHASVATIQWVATGYLLALALVIPLSGWAVERFGVRRLWFGSLDPVHRRLRAQRRRVVGGIAHRLPRPPGRRRGHDDAGRPDHARARRRALAHGPRHERDRRARPARPRPRPGHRRRHHRRPLVALDLLRQRARRHRSPCSPPGAGSAPTRTSAAPPRSTPSASPSSPRTGRVRLRPLRGRQRRLRSPARARRHHRRRAADRRLRRPRPAHPAPAARHAPVRGPQLRLLGGHDVRARGDDVRGDVPVPALRAGPARRQRTGRRLAARAPGSGRDGRHAHRRPSGRPLRPAHPRAHRARVRRPQHHRLHPARPAYERNAAGPVRHPARHRHGAGLPVPARRVRTARSATRPSHARARRSTSSSASAARWARRSSP